ncbi:putative reverse transcriptase domain-containing protein [Tanacetum coccineum]
MDGVDDGDDDDGDSSKDDADGEDEDDEDAKDDEEEEHLALANSAIVIPVDEPVFSPEGTEPAEVERLLAITTPSPSPPISLSPPSTGERLLRSMAPATHSLPPRVPSPLLPSSGCPTQIQTLRISSTQALIDAVTASLPSPPLPPLPPSLYIYTYHHLYPDMRLGKFTARPYQKIEDRYGFVSSVDVKEMLKRDGRRLVRVTELAELHERDIQDLYALLDDARDGLSQATHQELQTYRDHVYAHETHLQAHQTQLQLQGTLIQIQHQVHETRFQMQQAELATLRETDRRRQAQMQRRARQPGPDVRCPDHQDASGILTVTSSDAHYFILLGVVGLTRWIEKMESVFNISGCAIENQVKFATCTLLGAALTWWNGQIRTLGPEAYAMTWEVLKKKMTDKYCPQGEIKKLEIELWNLKVKGNDVPAYTKRFQELTLICTKFVANETKKVDKYISGLPDNIYGNVKSARPKMLDETFELANDLMDQKLCTYAER